MRIDHLRIADAVEGLDHVTLRNLRLDFLAERFIRASGKEKDSTLRRGIGDRVGGVRQIRRSKLRPLFFWPII